MSYAEVGGVSLWYEIHGEGDPLIVLHGGFGAVEMFAPLLPALCTGRQVIGVDLQGHGRTADLDRPLRYELLGDDVAGLIRHLGLGGADVLGHSLGAGAALRCAIQHPALVRHLVVISTPCRRAGWLPGVLDEMARTGPRTAEAMRVYERVAPRPQDWPRLAAKMDELLRQDYDWSQDLAAITASVQLVFADADAISPSHMAEFFALLGGGPCARLAVLPGRTHHDILAAPELADMVLRFLASQRP